MTVDLSVDDLLLAHASGRLAEPVALAVATHLALSPSSRERYAFYECLGGILLEGIAPAPVSAAAWNELCARLDGAEPVDGDARPISRIDQEVPSPLRPYLPGGLDGLRWRWMGGLSEALIDTASRDYRASLFRLKAGRSVLRHTHDGHEITVVLEGAFHDENGSYRRGDMTIADGSIEHQPVAEPGQDCLCLAVTDAPLRITGLIGRFINPLLRM